MAKFNIHAGHGPDGKIGCGAVGIIKESTQARKVKSYLLEYLKEEGHTVYDCTCDNGRNAGDILMKIVDKCNKHDVNLDVSIHFNSGARDEKGNGRTTGVEVLIYSNTSKAKPYAERICKKVAALGFKNRGVKVRKDLYFLRKTTSSALLVECCFVDDKDDCNIYAAKKMAKAIAEGILNKDLNNSDGRLHIGQKLSLNNCPCYKSAYAEESSNRKTGTYYLYSTDVVKNRVKITNSIENIGKDVTGWIDLKNVK